MKKMITASAIALLLLSDTLSVKAEEIEKLKETEKTVYE